MQVKILEVRDEATLIPMLCIDLNPDNQEQRYYLRRLGHPCDGTPNIGITHLNADRTFNNDPWSWRDRTYHVAHEYILNHWRELENGDVVDVRAILNECAAPAISERFSA